ncbi:PorP/SprF family type IX secretion system membrane protein [Flavobacterium sp.]|uniref:PorP/SprF family type IX secretion system membrane protein n=1 Tax=Flavobacterium sp. TaxID=239 RepID=UPI00286DBDE2|nr:PorP/SprF family type IX secretion system membrane protein [Flavobacterium sp.]
MKKGLFCSVVLFLCQASFSQKEDGVVSFDIPAKNSLKFNKFLINPAFSFVREDESFISIFNKRQWLDIENAPVNYFGSYSSKFRDNNGIAFGVFKKDYGILTSFGAIVNFAHNVSISNENNLTFGANLGYVSSGLDNGKVLLNEADPSLQNIPKNSALSVSPGINYGTGAMDFGLTANNIVYYSFASSSMVSDDPAQSFSGHLMYTGYVYNGGFFDKAKFSTLIRGELAKDQTIFSGSVLINVPKGFWAQAGYNTLYGASGGVGFTLAKKISLGYTIEKGLGNLANFGLSHEITIAYKLRGYGDYEDTKPIVKAKSTQKSNAAIAASKKAAIQAKEDAITQAKLDAIAKALADKDKLEEERLKKAQDIADAKAKAEAELLAKAEAEKVRLETERLAREKAIADAKKPKVDPKVVAEAERLRLAKEKAAADAERLRLAKEAADAKAKAAADAERLRKADVATKAEAERVRLAKVAADAKAAADAEAERLKKLAEDKTKSDAEKAKAEAERVRLAKEAADAKAKADAEAERLRKADAATRAEAERVRLAKEAADAKAKADAEAERLKKLAEDKTKSEAEKAKAEAERVRLAKEAADAKAKADAEAERLRKADAATRAEAERVRLAKVAADAKAAADAEAERLKKLTEDKAKADAERVRLAKEAADAKAKADAEAERLRKADATAKAEAERVRLAKEAADAKAKQEEEKARKEADAKAKADAEKERLRLLEEEKARALAAKTEGDKETDYLKELLVDSKKNQTKSLSRLDSIAAAKARDLQDLKDENEKGIVKEPKAFQSTVAANKALESLKKEISDNAKTQSEFITQYEDLYKNRLKTVPNKNDLVNQNYLKEIERLKSEKTLSDKRNTDLITKLEEIKIETEIERKKRIKRAAFDDSGAKYAKDRATLKQIKESTIRSATPLKPEDFDFGDNDQATGTQIVKNIDNVDNGYYMVVAVHKEEAKRDEFLRKAVAAGQTNIDFFYNVSTSTYYIYYEKFDEIQIATKALESKGSKPFNGKMTIVKVEK